MVGEEVFDAAKLTGKPAYATVIGILEDWRSAEGGAEKGRGRGRGRQEPGQAAAAGKDQTACAGALSLGDLLRRRQLCRSRRRNGGKREGNPPPPDPHTLGLKAWHFLKASRAIADPGATVKISGYAKNMDWEIELAAVIGRPAKDVPQDKALSYVAGYTVANDLSARDRGRRRQRSRRLALQDGTGPSTRLSRVLVRSGLGSCRQATSAIRKSSGSSSGSTACSSRIPTRRNMIFTLAEQIEQLSAGMTLYPGDLILTGTPAGVGAGRGEFLKAGDVVKLWVEKIGEIEQPDGVAAAAPPPPDAVWLGTQLCRLRWAWAHPSYI